MRILMSVLAALIVAGCATTPMIQINHFGQPRESMGIRMLENKDIRLFTYVKAMVVTSVYSNLNEYEVEVSPDRFYTMLAFQGEDVWSDLQVQVDSLEVRDLSGEVFFSFRDTTDAYLALDKLPIVLLTDKVYTSNPYVLSPPIDPLPDHYSGTEHYYTENGYVIPETVETIEISFSLHIINHGEEYLYNNSLVFDRESGMFNL